MKTKSRAVSSKDLRESDGLSHDVEKHLSELGHGASPLAVADDSTSSDDDSSSEHTSRSKKTRGKRDLKSGKTAKIASRVVRRQFWPHSELSMGYVTKDIGYDELSLEEFVAGYSAILLLPQVSSHERLHRTEHLGALMYLASIYEWPAVRSFHAVVLLEIERGRLNWGDSFLHLENRTLAGSHMKVKDQTKRPPLKLQLSFCFLASIRRVPVHTIRITTLCFEAKRNGCVTFVRLVGLRTRSSEFIPSIPMTAPINLNHRSDYLAPLSSQLCRTLMQLISRNFVLRTFLI